MKFIIFQLLLIKIAYKNSKLKKILIIAFVLHIIIICAFATVFLLLPSSDWNSIDNNIVKVIKETDIVNSYENQLSASVPNISRNISTWFFIDKNTVLTVAHWVNDESSNYTITDILGESYIATLIQKDNENDIAYLKTDRDFPWYQNLSYASEVKINEKVYTINYKWELKDWKIKKLEDNIIFSDMYFEDWDSGSPLINNKWELVWVNIATNFAEASWMSFKLIE